MLGTCLDPQEIDELMEEADVVSGCAGWWCFNDDHDCDDGDDGDGGDGGDGDEDQLTWFVPGRKRKDRLWRIRQDASEGVTRDQCENIMEERQW